MIYRTVFSNRSDLINKESEDTSKFIIESTFSAISSIIQPSGDLPSSNQSGTDVPSQCDKEFSLIANKVCDIDRILMPPPVACSSATTAFNIHSMKHCIYFFKFMNF